MRLKEFNLGIAVEKTKIINQGKNRDDDNDSDTGNFDFLGFTQANKRTDENAKRFYWRDETSSL